MTRLSALFASTFLALTLSACSTLDQKDTAKAPKPVKFEPKDGKILVFAGQSVDATLDYYRDLEGVPRPAGFSDYISYDVGSPYKPFAKDYPKTYKGNDGLLESTDWGSGNQCVDCNLKHADFAEAAINLGLYMAGPIMEDGSMCSGTEECNTYKLAQGLYDKQLNELADWLISLNGRPVFMRIGYEFEGSWNAYEPEQFKAAYKHIYHTLEGRGVNNVAYVLHTAGSIDEETLDAFYPKADKKSDSYVDWIGFTHFNGVGEVEMEFARKHGYKVFIGEAAPHTGDCTNQIDVATDNKQAKWWIDRFFKLIEDNRDVIRGFAYINDNWTQAPMWKDQTDHNCGGFFSQSNSRLNDNPEIGRYWGEKVSDDLYLNWEPGLYGKLYP